MKTPAGKECEFFYGNYFRGKSDEECRLLSHKEGKSKWTRDLCFTCPVPRIKMANSCSFMILHASVQKKFLGMKRQVVINATCSKSGQKVDVPEIGCGECHPDNPLFNLPIQ